MQEVSTVAILLMCCSLECTTSAVVATNGLRSLFHAVSSNSIRLSSRKTVEFPIVSLLVRKQRTNNKVV